MYLTVCIALGVFGGLWLFVRWGEWREAHWARQQIRQAQREVRCAERAARQPAAPWIKSGPWVGFAVVGFWIVVLAALGFSV
jgi:hypothetical protein